MFAEILRHSVDLIHFQAEINPFLRLAGFSHPAGGTASDRLETCATGDLDCLEHEMALDAGTRASAVDDIEQFALDLTWRLGVQWPDESFSPEAVQRWAVESLAAVSRGDHAPPTTVADSRGFHIAFLLRVRRAHPRVNPYYYDVAPDLLARAFPDVRAPSGPPSSRIIEEPPFVAIQPWRRAGNEDLRTCPLVIKTPSNAYRLGFLRWFFPKANLRVVHLTRNPAAAINGLFDGWRFAGFHSHRMPEPLRIAGYSDINPADADWWKFDLPHGWEEWTAQPLERVCAFQWTSAHRAILDFLDRETVDSIRVRFEDVVGKLARRRECFEKLAEWLGIPLRGEFLRAVEKGLPPIMATARPRHRRWCEKAGRLEPVLAEPKVQDLSERLGYGNRSTWG